MLIPFNAKSEHFDREVMREKKTELKICFFDNKMLMIFYSNK